MLVFASAGDVVFTLASAISAKNQTAECTNKLCSQSATAADKMAKWLRVYDEAKRSTEAVNTMHKYSLKLPLSDSETQALINASWPFVREYYKLPLSAEQQPYLFGGFATTYSAAGNKALDLHYDDSLYTINICLRDEDVRGGAKLCFTSALRLCLFRCVLCFLCSYPCVYLCCCSFLSVFICSCVSLGVRLRVLLLCVCQCLTQLCLSCCSWRPAISWCIWAATSTAPTRCCTARAPTSSSGSRLRLLAYTHTNRHTPTPNLQLLTLLFCTER